MSVCYLLVFCTIYTGQLCPEKCYLTEDLFPSYYCVTFRQVFSETNNNIQRMKLRNSDFITVLWVNYNLCSISFIRDSFAEARERRWLGELMQVTPKIMPPIYFCGNYNTYKEHTLMLCDRANFQMQHTIFQQSPPLALHFCQR